MDEPAAPALGRYQRATGAPRVTVRLLDAPLALWDRATAHHDELVRELSLLAVSDPATLDLPPRLVELVQLLGGTYGRAAPRPEVVGDRDRADLVFDVPVTAGEDAQALRDALAEVGEYCRSGALMTMAPTPEMDAFGEWYFANFRDQVAGGPPVPWPGPWS